MPKISECWVISNIRDIHITVEAKETLRKTRQKKCKSQRLEEECYRTWSSRHGMAVTFAAAVVLAQDLHRTGPSMSHHEQGRAQESMAAERQGVRLVSCPSPLSNIHAHIIRLTKLILKRHDSRKGTCERNLRKKRGKLEEVNVIKMHRVHIGHCQK